MARPGELPHFARCPRCGALPGVACKTAQGRPRAPHASRRRLTRWTWVDALQRALGASR
jgi:hypothetical protein